MVTSNTLATGDNITGFEIEFTGHGYKGIISAASNVSGVSLGSSGGKDVLTITLTQK